MAKAHAALDPPRQRALLVSAEILLGPRAQQSQDGVQVVRRFLHQRPCFRAAVDIGMLDITQQHFRHLVHGQDIIHESGGDGAAGHVVIMGGFWLLHHSHTAVLFHRPQPQRAFRAGAGQDDADGPFLLVAG